MIMGCIGRGLFKVTTGTKGTGVNTITYKTTRITGKGQVYFASKIKESNNLIAS